MKTNEDPRLAEAHTMSFADRKRERLFLMRNIRKSLGQSRVAFILGLLMYCSFAVLDYHVAPESFALSAVLRLVAAPALIVLCLYLTHRFKSYLELWSMLVLSLTQIGHLVLVSLGDYPDVYLAVVSSIVIVFCLTFSSLRLRYALTFLAVDLVATFAVYALVVRPETDGFLFATYTLLSFSFLGILAGYSREFYVRQDFIQSDALMDEKKKSESLLLNILPRTVAQELKASGTTKPVSYDGVTVLFADFVGFTQRTSGIAAEPVISTLDRYFSYFDYITKKYKLEKIKTIGDAYMLAGGLDTSIPTHAVDCILASFDFLDFVRRDAAEHGDGLAFDLRIGVHTGPVIAGVLGSLKFSYDIFGSTVNVASRMEKYSEGNCINVSRNTYELIKDFFECESRGIVEVKNGEHYEMFFVRGLKSELCLDREGNIPNGAFVALYNKLAESIPETTRAR
ncbi:MAG TPA: adenylate/guanylate cyclase domain-containing protein [Treponemataceae bacterium]|jgi:class 3 adenylate cyclase|nr:adenylate/guanylate cyclase domain-containing protein [Treponemataceae bacterium]